MCLRSPSTLYTCRALESATVNTNKLFIEKERKRGVTGKWKSVQALKYIGLREVKERDLRILIEFVEYKSK